jgi:transcriptional regulator with XRE-family HTH domain
MNDNNSIDAVGDLGIRFLLFRKAIRKSRSQLASELGIKSPEIEAIENGTAMPKINYLHYISTAYGLNINWMLCNEGRMFVEEGVRPPGLDPDYAMKPPVGEGEPGYEAYLEFIQLMRVPVIEKSIMQSLQEIKDRLRQSL